jgi:energy-coupling factor transporter ATP-binding protein EcfA2
MPARPRPRGILLTGSVGSGKTRLLHELGELLEEREEPYALVDLDWLAWCRPTTGFAVRDILVRNLEAAWKTFAAAGIERLVLARHVELPGDVAALRGALPGVELTVVEVRSPLGVVEARLRARDTGRELAEHLAEARRCTAAGASPVADATVENGDRPIRDVAREALAAAGWAPR